MINLRPFIQDDFERLKGWVTTPELLMMWSGPLFHYPLDDEQLHSYLHSSKGDPADRLIYTAIDIESQQPIGHIELSMIDRVNRSAVATRVLVGETVQRGKGIGKSMVHEVLHIAFDELHLHRVGLHVFDFNSEAIQCYESVGLTREGLLRDAHTFGDQYWSVIVMSILENEWSRVSDIYFPPEPDERK